MSEKKPGKSKGRITGRKKFLAGRFSVLFTLTLVMAIFICGFLIDTTVVHSKEWRLMGDSSLMQTRVIMPSRGDILAADGSLLATNLRYYNVRIDLGSKNFMIVEFDSLIPELSDSLAHLFPNRTAEEWQRHLRRGISVPRASRSRGWSIARKVDLATANACRRLPFFNLKENAAYTGLVIEPVMVRSYPFGDMARMSIGRVGQTDSDATVRGRSGLERALDTLLFGVPGVKRSRLGTRGTYMAVDTPAIDGYDVTTTIDITVQDILESELGEMLLSCNADWGSAMIMEVHTGDIKAISNLERDSTARVPTYVPALNRLVKRYEPGSVMKVMTMAVALKHGYAHLDQSYPIGRSYGYLGRKPIQDTHSPGSLLVRQFLTYSSNIGMCKMSMPQYENNTNLFRERLAEMGFFDRLNTGIAREIPPFFPTLQNNVGGRLSLSRMVFGYTTGIPPLYTCAFYNAVANDGHFVRPRLVKALRSPDGVDSVIPTSYVRESILTPEQARQLREMMHGVVWDQGGTAPALKNPIVEIAGKTGTAKIALEDKRPRYDEHGNKLNLPPFKGGYREGHNRVTFCGFFPYENPKYTMIVVISDPQPKRGPSVTSGTVLKNVALKMYARGMLDEGMDFEPVASRTAPEAPLVHTSFDAGRRAALHQTLRAGQVRTFTRPAAGYPAGQVPDVRGISFREALATLEGAGYSVDFEGLGFVDAQTPEAGTEASPGTRVHLTLKNLN